MIETVGQILKKARTQKKITLKEASESTKITSRHLTALEEDNYQIFPGETYTIGFLKNYASYLSLDPEQLIQMYRGSQLDELEPPIKQLTEPTVIPMDYVKKYMTLILGVSTLIIVTISAFFIFNKKNTPLTDEGTESVVYDIKSILKESQKIPDIETEHVKLQSGFATALISVKNGIDFSVHNTEAYIVLDTLEYRSLENGLSKAQIYYYPGKKQMTLIENQTVTIDENNADSFKIKLIGATPNTIKIQIDVPEIETASEMTNSSNQIANPSNFIIIFEATTTGNNFVEFYVDGQPRKKGLLPSGSNIHYEANDSIQLKIGDAGAIDIKINGKPYIFGKKGVQVNKIIRKVKDPLEQTHFTVSVKDS